MLSLGFPKLKARMWLNLIPEIRIIYMPPRWMDSEWMDKAVYAFTEMT